MRRRSGSSSTIATRRLAVVGPEWYAPLSEARMRGGSEALIAFDRARTVRPKDAPSRENEGAASPSNAAKCRGLHADQRTRGSIPAESKVFTDQLLDGSHARAHLNQSFGGGM